MHAALEHVEHRPWPLPDRPWVWRQQWHDLLFAHWPVPAAAMRAMIPRELEIQEWEGSAWIGVVPFRMRGVMRRPLPDLPGISAFPELNVRTYVRGADKPGVWFFSLDAASRLAVWAARALFNLPYHHARFGLAGTPERIAYRAARTGGSIRFAATYGPAGEPYGAEAGTLEHWLTERYCLYAQSRAGQVVRTEVHHRPWPLQAAEAEIVENGMLDTLALPVPRASPLLHFSRRVDVVVWGPEPILKPQPWRDAMRGYRTTVLSGAVLWAACGTEAPAPGVTHEFSVVQVAEIGGGEGEGALSQVYGVTVSAGERVYVSEPQFARVVEFDRDGAFVRVVGGRGRGPGEFQVPGSMFWLGDSLAVAIRSRNEVEEKNPASSSAAAGDPVEENTARPVSLKLMRPYHACEVFRFPGSLTPFFVPATCEYRHDAW